MRSHFCLLPYPLSYHIQDGIFSFMAKQPVDSAPLLKQLAEKQVQKKNKPGFMDDLVRLASTVKRGLISNPSNKNKASNLDKLLRGGKAAGDYKEK